MDRLDRVAVAAVVMFVVLLGAGVVAGRDTSVSAGPPWEELVDAWARTRTMTHRSLGTFERESSDGDRLAAPTEVVQRPPDRLVRGFDEVRGRRDDRELTCVTPPAGTDLDCTLGPEGRSFEEVAAAEVETFRSLVAGERPLYEVRRAGAGCWRMTRTRYDPRSGYGNRATLCFAEGSGVLRSIEIDHGDVTETTTYHDVSLEVSDADLEP